MPSIVVLEIEEGHGENRGQISSGKEYGAEEGYGFHSCGIAFGSVGQLALFASHLEIKLGFFLRDDVVELVLLLATCSFGLEMKRKKRVINKLTAARWMSNLCKVVYA